MKSADFDSQHIRKRFLVDYKAWTCSVVNRLQSKLPLHHFIMVSTYRPPLFKGLERGIQPSELDSDFDQKCEIRRCQEAFDKHHDLVSFDGSGEAGFTHSGLKRRLVDHGLDVFESEPSASTRFEQNLTADLNPVYKTCETVEPLDAVIVGAGFGGIWLLYQLRKRGYKVKLLEAGSELGGVWNNNRYPGARVDSEVPLYEFSIEEIRSEWTWSERFPRRDEILEYFRFVDHKLKLSQDCVFHAFVKSAVFDEMNDTWTVTSADEKHYCARFFLPCLGVASKMYVPAIQGLQTFRGPCVHTGAWPKECMDLKAKRVGIIGTGASGVQLIQEIAPEVEHLVS